MINSLAAILGALAGILVFLLERSDAPLEYFMSLAFVTGIVTVVFIIWRMMR